MVRVVLGGGCCFDLLLNPAFSRMITRPMIIRIVVKMARVARSW